MQTKEAFDFSNTLGVSPLQDKDKSNFKEARNDFENLKEIDLYSSNEKSPQQLSLKQLQAHKRPLRQQLLPKIEQRKQWQSIDYARAGITSPADGLRPT